MISWAPCPSASPSCRSRAWMDGEMDLFCLSVAAWQLPLFQLLQLLQLLLLWAAEGPWCHGGVCLGLAWCHLLLFLPRAHPVPRAAAAGAQGGAGTSGTSANAFSSIFCLNPLCFCAGEAARGCGDPSELWWLLSELRTRGV